MNSREATALDRALSRVCELCPVCLHARHYRKGIVHSFVMNIEDRICPFCQAYERVHGRKAHEPRD